MKILLVNDDGINSPSLKILADKLRHDNDVKVIAPNKQYSGGSHAVSLHKPVKYAEADLCGVTAYSVDGTPGDCVKFGIIRLLPPWRPDIIFSGINLGANLATDTMYSGTVAAATEGAYLGVRSIALSVTTHAFLIHQHERAADFVAKNLNVFLSVKLPKYSILNINFPTTETIAGIAYAALGTQEYDDKYEEREPGEFYLRGVPSEHVRSPFYSDLDMIHKGYITVTPLKIDRTDSELLNKLRAEGGFSL